MRSTSNDSPLAPNVSTNPLTLPSSILGDVVCCLIRSFPPLESSLLGRVGDWKSFIYISQQRLSFLLSGLPKSAKGRPFPELCPLINGLSSPGPHRSAFLPK
ncbi:hypothetical protein TNIN_30371 [Trichonephila inaurata madagascariensis]|uniref:Uncharacterized protein n=1 Tax=Trichonephila inaurata madagascariensis TaxID=2747483 RepID=A0A8X7CK70_9ARAC|nr:hypothetical protein TNIN_30371 [Trichonephila inaurata madagascariensis]